MTDDVKAAIERFRDLIAPFSGGYVRVASRSCGGYNAHNYDEGICRDCGFDGMNPTGEMLLGEAQDLLAHIDGEPARIAAKGEEVREACARHIWAMSRRPTAEELMEMVGFARSTPLTATPLADALRLANETVVKLAQAATEAQARAEEGVRYWTDLAQAEARDAAALRARVAELEAELAMVRAAGHAAFSISFRPIIVSAGKELTMEFEGVEAERDVLRAQVEAARAECARVHNAPRCMNAYDVATDVRRAMDGAKP